MTDETQDKPRWPRTNKLDAPDVGTLSGHDFARHRSRVFRAVKADALERKVAHQQEQYEAEQEARELRQEGDDE